MQADFTIKAGDDSPILSDSLSLANGEAMKLEGATVTLEMRLGPTLKSLPVEIVKAKEGKIQWKPTAAQTGTPGMYIANWRVVIGEETMTFPTVGYLWIEIQENLVASGANLIVSLPEVKDYLQIGAAERVNDAKLIRYIEAVRPLVENIAGPMLPSVFEEWHYGGNYFVSLRRRPSTTWGTEPILNLMAVSEFRGPQEYPLSIIQDPAHGELYSCMLEPAAGLVIRRTSGGGVIAFPNQPQAVHVVYQAGQKVVPRNIAEATLEILRVNYQSTMSTGRGRRTVADEEELPGASMGFFIPRRVRELLAPNKRASSIF